MPNRHSRSRCKTVNGFDPDFTYLEIDHLKDGKIIKHFYGKVPK